MSQRKFNIAVVSVLAAVAATASLLLFERVSDDARVDDRKNEKAQSGRASKQGLFPGDARNKRPVHGIVDSPQPSEVEKPPQSNEDGSPESRDIGIGAPPAEPRWKERPEGEWQGMLVDLNVAPACVTATDCGLARACLEGTCGPCEANGDGCADDEECVLDHCVVLDKIKCRGRADCANGQCVLSGYSASPRGNEEMEAVCSAELAEQNAANSVPQASGTPADPSPIDLGNLSRLAREALSQSTSE